MNRRDLVRWIFLIILMAALVVVLPPDHVSASELNQEFCFTDYDWTELEMGSFVLIFPLEQTNLAQMIFTNFPGELETMFDEYRQVFNVELILPVAIRIYPSRDDFDCLNPLAPQGSAGAVHSHIGEREIALFAESIPSGEDVGGVLIHNALRHELAVLFSEQLSGGYAPSGLLMGIGVYSEDPEQTFLDRFAAAGSMTAPRADWQTIWEEQTLLQTPSGALQAGSIAAFLVDVYGWGKMIDLLKEINRQQGYRQALVDIYGLNSNQLGAKWEYYFTIYTAERWHVNVFHNYDLESFQVLITAGAYEDAVPGLEEAINLLSILGTPEQVSDAEDLLAKAALGTQAGELTAQSRRELLSGNYLESYTSAELALDYYSQLGDSRRINELEAYMAVSREVLDLRKGLEIIRDQGVGINPFRSQTVFDIGQRLMELGDQEGVEQAEAILFILGAGQNTFFQFLISLVVLISIGLIVRRIMANRKDVPPEADLL
jgi:hypothetical protein